MRSKGLIKRFCDDTEYIVTMPNMYARNILFGKMIFELGDICTAKCEGTGMSCDLDFKTKVSSASATNRKVTNTVPGVFHWNLQRYCRTRPT